MPLTIQKRTEDAWVPIGACSTNGNCVVGCEAEVCCPMPKFPVRDVEVASQVALPEAPGARGPTAPLPLELGRVTPLASTV